MAKLEEKAKDRFQGLKDSEVREWERCELKNFLDYFVGWD